MADSGGGGGGGDGEYSNLNTPISITTRTAMADSGGGGGDGEYSNLSTPISITTRTAMADGGGEDVVEGRPCLVSPPPFKIRKLGAPGTSSIGAQSDAMAVSNFDEFLADLLNPTDLMDIGSAERFEQDILNTTSDAVVEMENKTTVGEGEVEMDDLGKSKFTISEQEIGHLHEQLKEMVSIIEYRIIPSAPLCCSSSSGGVGKGGRSMVKELAGLQRSMSKFKSQLKPFWHKYPYEIVPTALEVKEKRDKSRREFEKMDNKEKARKEMDFDARDFEGYCKGMSDRVEHFEFTTQVSPMHFTHYTPRQIPHNYTSWETTLQIFSFKIAKIDLDLQWPLLQWPLKVYGIVAARDEVDRRRNLLFFRESDDFQEITQEKPFLCLTGPSRAILAEDAVNLEVQLKLKGPTDSEDSVLITKRCEYSQHYTVNGLYTFTFENRLCTTELSLQRLYRGSVQATFLRVGGFVKGNTSPFIHGGRVSCSTLPYGGQGTASSTQVVLLDSHYCDGGKMPIGEEDGYLDLSRRVVSVESPKVSADSEELEETLKVVIEAYSESPPKVSAQADFKVKPQYCGISEHECVLKGSTVKIAIAWSAILRTNKVIP